jgi:hypothetical protein
LLDDLKVRNDVLPFWAGVDATMLTRASWGTAFSQLKRWGYWMPRFRDAKAGHDNLRFDFVAAILGAA